MWVDLYRLTRVQPSHHGADVTVMILQKLGEHAQQRPEAVAFREIPSGIRLTYRQLARAVMSVASQLRRVIQPGEVVLLSCPNRVAVPVAFLGALCADVKLWPVSPRLSARELREAASRSDAAACIGSDSGLEILKGRVRHLLAIDRLVAGGGPGYGREDDGCVEGKRWSGALEAGERGELYLLSSGTTARPKIVRRSFGSLDAVASNCVRALGLGPTDAVLTTLPMSHSYGMEHGLLAPVWAGAGVVLCDGFDLPTVMDGFRHEGVTVFPGVPFMFEAMSRLDDQDTEQGVGALRCAYSAGGPISGSVLARLRTSLNLPMGQLYGCTEAGSVTFLPPSACTPSATNVGWPMEGVVVKILDADPQKRGQCVPPGGMGQIAVRAPSMLEGYLGEPLDEHHHGFFMTGDLGRIDEQGCVHVTGRLKLLIDVGGLKVNPLEVEQVICEHPDVGQCVVTTIPVSQTLNRLRAVVTAQGQRRPEPEQLRRFSRARMAAHKVPRVFEVVDRLPRLANGKVDRRAVEAGTITGTDASV